MQIILDIQYRHNNYDCPPSEYRADFDIIYHMENGRIIESGTHEELMAARGKYYEMFIHQAENYVS